MQPGLGRARRTAGHFADTSETNCLCVGGECRVTAGVIRTEDTGEGCEGNPRHGRHAASVTQLYMSRGARLYLSRRGWRLQTAHNAHISLSHIIITLITQHPASVAHLRLILRVQYVLYVLNFFCPSVWLIEEREPKTIFTVLC